MCGELNEYEEEKSGKKLMVIHNGNCKKEITENANHI